MTKQKEILTDSAPMELSPMLVAGVGAAVKTLNLTLNKEWFDMILSGDKTEEYREIKPHWITRLVDTIFKYKTKDEFMKWYYNPPDHVELQHVINNWDTVTFKNGYSKKARAMIVEFKSVEIGVGLYVWGAPNYPVFIIKLGKILETKNV